MGATPNPLMIDAENGKVYRQLGHMGGHGYLRLGRGAGSLVHRVIWESVHGPIPEGMHINHINAVKTDNRIANLECVTPKENIAHSLRLGLRDHANAKPPHRKTRLTAEQITRLKEAKYGTVMTVAREMGIAPSYAYQVRNGRRISERTILADRSS